MKSIHVNARKPPVRRNTVLVSAKAGLAKTLAHAKTARILQNLKQEKAIL